MGVWTKETIADFLSREGWLARQPADFRDQVLAAMKPLRLAAGSTVFEMGEYPPRGMYALLEGRLHTSYHLDNDESLLLWTAGPGAWFGEAALLDDAPRPFEIVAASDVTLLFLSAAAFNRLVEDEPRFYRNFALLTCANLRANFRGMIAGRLDARTRAARAFLRLVRAHGRPVDGGVMLDAALSQSEIASLVGVSRQYMNELLTQWQKEGLITLEAGTIRIRKLEGLETQARLARGS